MHRRRFIQGLVAAGATAGLSEMTVADDPSQGTASHAVPSTRSFRDRGWVWEGQGIDPEVPPSIYGLGQGARYFGLSRANFLFHPNDEHALTLLQGYDEVTCDISKWGWEWNADGRPACKAQGDPATVQAEGEKVARLAQTFTNVTGAYCDDLLGLMKTFHYGPAEFARIRAAIRERNPTLKLWSVIYTHEFDEADFWAAMRPHLDVISLWIWNSEHIPHLRRYVEESRTLFPDKPIVMGIYLRDYAKRAPVPLDRIQLQMEGIARLVDESKLDGYTILASVLIDGHRPQAEAVRNFIAAQSGQPALDD